MLTACEQCFFFSAQRLDSIYVTRYFSLLKTNTDSVPQSFAHGVTTEAQKFPTKQSVIVIVGAIGPTKIT